MPSWINRQTLGWAAGAAGGLALMLFPGSVITLGIGIALGYRGRSWLEQTERSVQQ